MKTIIALSKVIVALLRQYHPKNHPAPLGLSLFLLLVFTVGSHHSNAQCVAPSMTFHSPVLISGVNNEVGSEYLFSEVIPGVDAHIKITDLVGGAVLWNIDDSTGAGYYDAFQPYVVAPANSTSYLEWAITFKVAGTSTDTTLACFAITGVDVDGNGADLQEFIEAATPGSFALDPYTILGFSFDGIRSKAVSTIANIPLIDTAHLEAMFQMNFKNISTLQYRNGAISNHGADMVRQTCIYFKSFFNNFTMLLPVKLLSFTAQTKNESVRLNWSATNESDLKYYTVQKSIDGSSWRDIQTVLPGAAATNSYFITDAEKSAGMVYYRLMQVVLNGKPVYSKMLKMAAGGYNGVSITSNTMVTNAVQLQVSAVCSDTYSVELFAMNGSRIQQQRLNVQAGNNAVSVAMTANAGVYILAVTNNRGELVHHAKLVKN